MTKQHTTRKFVAELRPGDMVDLTGDSIADPHSDRVEFETEFAIVREIDRETPDCTAVYFDNVAFGFSPGHMLPVAPCPTLQIEMPREFSDTERDLAASLACYCSPDDWGDDRATFLRSVAERILLDLKVGV